MLPYGWTKELPEDYDRLFNIGKAGQDAIKVKHGTEYALGTISNIICKYQFQYWIYLCNTINNSIFLFNILNHLISDVASGSSVDWVYDELQPSFALAYELRDTGAHGFILPSDQIIGTAEETFDSVVAMLKQIDE